MEPIIFRELVTPHPPDNLTADDIARREEERLNRIEQRQHLWKQRSAWWAERKERIAARRRGPDECPR